MNKQELVKLAQEELRQPSREAADEFSEKRDELAAELSRRMKARPDVERLIGQSNENMMDDNHRNQMRFMESQFKSFNPQVLVETVFWVMSAYPAHGFQLAYWPAVLNEVAQIIKDNLSEKTYHELYPFYHWLIIHHPGFVQ